MRIFKSKSKLAFILAALIFTNITYAQSARALFGNSGGVSFNAQNKEIDSVAQEKKGNELPKAQSQTTNPQKVAKKADSGSTLTAYSGLSYKILQEYPGGELKQVSPDKVFRSGDRIKVVISSNKSGELSVSNIDPTGKLSQISEQSVVAGSPVGIPSNGFLKFVGAKGTEQLVFVLSSVALSKQTKQANNPLTTIISSCFQNKSTRSLILDDSAGNEVGVVAANGNCTSPNSGKTRGLVVEVAENAGYAVIPDAALAEGQMLTLKINLRHQ